MNGRHGVLALLVASLAGCGPPAKSERFLLDAAREVLPAVKPNSTTGQPLNTGEWGPGGVYYELFTVLRDFEPSTDQGKIGVDNVFMNIWLAGVYYSDNYGRLENITPHPVASPFPFKTLDGTLTETALSDTYDRGKNLLGTSGAETTEINMAARETDGVTHGLVTFKNRGGWNVIQATHAEKAGDLELNLVTTALEGTSKGYIQRNYVRGNTKDHSFVVKMSKYNNISGGYRLALVGKGTSRGTSAYFLFRLKDNNGGNVRMGPGEAGAYYCIAGDATESTLSALASNAGSATVDAACASYQADVDRMWRDVWSVSAAADVPTEAASFANSSLQLNL